MHVVPATSLFRALGLEEGATVTIWRPAGEKFYHVGFRIGSRFINRSTGAVVLPEARLKGAEIFAAVVAAPRAKENQATLDTLAEQLNQLTAIVVAAGKGQPSLALLPSKPIETAFHEYILAKADVSASHLYDLKRCNKPFLAYCKGAGIKNLSEVKPEHVRSFLGLSKNWQAKTFNRYLNSISAFLQWCWKMDYIPLNPATKVDKKRTGSRGIPQTITVDQARRFMAAMEDRHPEWVTFYALAIFGGLRADKSDGEITRLYSAVSADGWDKYLTERYLWVPHQKTGGVRKIDMLPTLFAWLTAYKDQRVVPHRCSNSKLAKEFNIPYNGCRHTAISAYVSAGNDLSRAAVQFGTSEAIIRKNYLNLWAKTDAAEFYQILPKTAETARTTANAVAVT